MCSKARSCKSFGRKLRNKRPPHTRCKKAPVFLSRQKNRGFFLYRALRQGREGRSAAGISSGFLQRVEALLRPGTETSGCIVKKATGREGVPFCGFVKIFNKWIDRQSKNVVLFECLNCRWKFPTAGGFGPPCLPGAGVRRFGMEKGAGAAHLRRSARIVRQCKRWAWCAPTGGGPGLLWRGCPVRRTRTFDH